MRVMSEVVTDPGEAALAVETNLFALFRAMAAALPGSEIIEGESVSMHLTPPTNPMFKGAWCTRVGPGELEETVDATVEWFRARHTPFFFWWTGPATDADGLDAALRARGLISMAEQEVSFAAGITASARGSPGMIADLDRLSLDVLETVPDGFEISDVQTEADLDEFQRVLMDVYGLPGPMANAWIQAATTVGIGRTPWRMYLGRLGGRVVATSMVLRGAGVAGVYGVATMPDARGRGIGGAVTLAPLLEDRDAGVRYGVLFSSREAVGAYRRIGFREVDVWIDRYLWRAP
jgi:ribosomal protein S18 acetylase RimI-like enzyme